MFSLVPLAALLLALGLRGRHIDNHPHCRRCKFDLIGHPATPAPGTAGATPCPECGADLGVPTAIRQGMRQRRIAPTLIGAALLAIVAAGGVWLTFGGSGLNRYKPVWMLRMELAGASPTAAAKACAELDFRIRKAGTLTPSQAESVAAVVLARQADDAREWEPRQGDLLEVAQANGLLTPQTWATYAKQAAQFTVRGRAKAVEGEPWAIDVMSGSARLGQSNWNNGLLSLRSTLVEAMVDNKPINLDDYARTGFIQGNMSASGQSWSTLKPTLSLPPGKYVVASRWTLRVVPGYGAMEPADPRNPPVFAEWEVTRQTPVTVLPAGSTLVELVRDESLRGPMQKLTRVDQCEINPTGDAAEPGAASQSDTKYMLNGMLYFDTPPMDLAFEVFWRIRPPEGTPGTPDPIELAVGEGTATRPTSGQMTMGVGFNKEVAAPAWLAKVKSIDVILRPSRAAAMKAVEIDRIWDGELVFEGVKVKGPARESEDIDEKQDPKP